MRLFSATTLLAASLWLSSSTHAIDMTQTILDYLEQWNIDWSFPRVVDIARGVHYSGLTDDVVGRVDITQTFIGNELNTEYLFGMFASLGTANTTQLVGWPLNQTVTKLIIQGNTASVSIIVNFNWTVTVVPVEFNIWWLFSEEGKVKQYDVILVRAPMLFNTVVPHLVPLIAAELNEPIPANPMELIVKRAALDICAAHDRWCHGANQQYASNAECLLTIMTQKPFGEIWAAGQDTAICRYLHKGMIQYRPDVHCPHIGPSGGGACTDKDYTSIVNGWPFEKPFRAIPPVSEEANRKKIGKAQQALQHSSSSSRLN